MSYEHERDEWGSAVAAMTEWERAEFERPTLTELINPLEEDCE